MAKCLSQRVKGTTPSPKGPLTMKQGGARSRKIAAPAIVSGPFGEGVVPLTRWERHFAMDFTPSLPVIREHRAVPDRVVHVQTHEPAEQQVVVIIELLHQQSLPANRIEAMQQQRPQHFFRRERGPSPTASMASNRRESRFSTASTIWRIRLAEDHHYACSILL